MEGVRWLRFAKVYTSGIVDDFFEEVDRVLWRLQIQLKRFRDSAGIPRVLSVQFWDNRRIF